MAQRPVTLTYIVRGHVSLEIEGFERLYFNGWCRPCRHRARSPGGCTGGDAVASPAALGRNSQAFRAAVRRCGREPDPVDRLPQGDR